MRIPLTMAALFVAACGGGDAPPASDSTVALTPTDTAAAVVSAEELAPPAAPAEAAPTQSRPSRPATRPAEAQATTTPPPAPAPVPVTPVSARRVAAVGSEFTLAANREISSRTNKTGETFTARVTEAVADQQGREVIPVGAVVTFRIEDIHEAENRNDEGRLVIAPVSVLIGDQTIPLAAEITDLQYELKGRGVSAGDAGKVAAGAAIGAIVGQVLTKRSTGTVVGGAIGAAAGTAIAIRSADKDIVVPAGARIALKLTQELVVGS